jgi:hypothetical protein
MYESSEFASEVFIHLPPDDSGGLEESRVLRRAMRKVGDEKRFRITHEDTSVPGLYRLELKRPYAPEGDTTQYFAVNIPTVESDLRGMNADDFQAYFDLQPNYFDASARFRELARQEDLLRGYEFWPWFLGAALALLALETALAQFFGREKR